jgi:hypothetical protein
MSEEEVVIIEDFEAVTYDNLKDLHNKSINIVNDQASALNNLSHVLLHQSKTPSPTPLTLYSSKNIKISKSIGNWLVPYARFKEGCHCCGYFGHSFKVCPNIVPQFRGACLKCWEFGHDSSTCIREKKNPPYNDEFTSSEEVVELLISKSS